ncbi:MAG: hypothetical protein EOT05_01300 [Candidatus Microsaccharimonas sossegonensis]|uniref:TrbC/VIRB2 family protein n=1 Tax=Candidatus Microsaccharimonas sossegonensis TaxID=2506948 RepID=A0A4Q0AGV3_9BACT|nr:MAG: hypothetical protein EOT05_01300 [Candidatus Microsaccharimonas sossegonensis]
MKILRSFAPVLLAVVLVLGASIFLARTSFALTVFDGVNAAKGTGQPTELFGGGGIVTNITNFLLFIVGALSVIMLIVGGLRYVVSGGNSTAVTAAKNTVLYAIVGLVIAFLAYAAINFVINTLAPGATSGGTNV